MRMTLQEDDLSQARFPISQPSLQFVSFEGPRVTEAGRFLDQKAASALGQVGFPVPARSWLIHPLWDAAVPGGPQARE